MAEAEVLRKALRVVSGAEERVSFFETRPFFSCEGYVAAFGYVVVHGDDVERSGVSGGESVGIIREPWNEVGALRDFVGDFSVGALELAKKIERGAGAGEIAGGVVGERGPHGVAAEKPGEAGALSAARGAVAGDDAGAEVGIFYYTLQYADARPVVGSLELRVRECEADGAGEIIAIVVGGAF